MNEAGQIEIYQAEDGQTEIRARFENDTIWLSQTQMVELFGVDKSGISRHLMNILKTGERVRDLVVAKFATTAADKKTYQVAESVRNQKDTIIKLIMNLLCDPEAKYI
ncbi:hypothetical protein [Desulfobacter curvatus]|uniref:hypothetical protein n=1 Tax=Desulfobacter curvatus TaxID=2290 RepID=UPI000362FF2F|nr:hypothetical protein [Desulfobacter curvatus]